VRLRLRTRSSGNEVQTPDRNWKTYPPFLEREMGPDQGNNGPEAAEFGEEMSAKIHSNWETFYPECSH